MRGGHEHGREAGAGTAREAVTQDAEVQSMRMRWGPSGLGSGSLLILLLIAAGA